MALGPAKHEKEARQGGFRNVFRIAGARQCGAIRGIIPAISQGQKAIEHVLVYVLMALGPAKHIGGHTHVILSMDA